MMYLILFYSLLLLFIGFYLKKHKSGDEFLISDRKVGWLMISASLFTLIGGGELATLATLSYHYGFSGVYLLVGFALGFVVLTFVVNKIRNGAEEHLYHSLPDYFYTKYGKSSGLITTILSFVAFFALLIIQFTAGAQIITALSGWGYTLSLLLMGVIIAIYLAFGGFKSVLATDVIQGVAMLVILPLILWAISNGNEMNFSSLEFTSLDSFSIFSFIFTGIFVVISSADIWQRIYAAKDNINAKKGLYVSAILFVVFGLGLSLLGIFAKQNLVGIDPNNAFIASVTNLLPAWGSGLVILLVFSSIMSTADTEIFLLSSIFSREVSRWKGKYKSNKLASEITTQKTARIAVFGVTILALIASLFFQNLVEVYVFLLSVILIVSPPLLLGFLFKLNNKVVTLSLIIGLLTFIILIIFGILNVDNLVLIIIPEVLVTLILNAALGTKKE